MSIRRSESFVRGALMLSVAALVSRLLGAFYKPAIARIFAPFDGHNGAVGIGLTQVPLTVYQVVLSFTSVGLNVGISRLVAERMAVSDVRGARRVFRFSLLLMAVIGFVGSVALWFGAPALAALISESAAETVPGFRAMAPAIFLTSVLAAYRGLFQGLQSMSPNAMSQIVEQIVRVGAGLLLTAWMVQRSVALGAAGFNFGDVIGAGIALLYLLYLARGRQASLWESESASALEAPQVRPAWANETPWELTKRIFSVAGPITIVGAVVPLMMLADTFFVFRALGAQGLPKDEIQAAYGYLTNVFMIVNLPGVFTQALYTSILPAITTAITLREFGVAKERAAQAYRMTFLLALPAQAGLWALAAGIYSLIYGDLVGAHLLQTIAWATVPIMLQQTTSGILQGMGQIGLPVRNFMIGAVLKVILTAVLTRYYGVEGAAWATVVGFAVAAILNLYHVDRHLGRTFRLGSMLLRPGLAAVLMAATILGLKVWLPQRALFTLLLVAVGGLVYGLSLLVTGGLRRKDLEALPKVGRPLAGLLERTRLLR
ncbi:MAG TPA: polysaccharide biosynthesis protein [Symbiobacteriaceae bacterium]|nr:polysaccharide biosynthesis protein [Symbiobacteriaceae bacterium]